MRLTDKADLFRLVLSVGSFISFRIARLVVRTLISLRNRVRLNKPVHWMGFSELVAKSWGVPFLVVTAPRWNCHATIALTDSFAVRSHLRVPSGCADNSAQGYSFVIYPESGAPFTLPPDSQGNSGMGMDLLSGRYRIGARYYGSCADPEFPEILADGVSVVPGRVISGERDRYREQLTSLQGRETFLCGCLHYYVFHFLSWRMGGEAFLKREFLPVGNPETDFEYDAIRKDQVREITCEGNEGERRTYVTLYNRQSFPVFWTEIQSFPYRLKAGCDGFYLIRRVVAQSGGSGLQ
jgi:hypothetical protein